MAEEVAVTSKKTCSLPGKCIYLGHVLCFLLSATSCILVILYGQKFGADIALQWLLALLFSFIFSFLFVEPVKAIFIALYLAAWEKKTEDTDDVIVNEPKFDMSNELVKVHVLSLNFCGNKVLLDTYFISINKNKLL